MNWDGYKWLRLFKAVVLLPGVILENWWAHPEKALGLRQILPPGLRIRMKSRTKATVIALNRGIYMIIRKAVLPMVAGNPGQVQMADPKGCLEDGISMHLQAITHTEHLTQWVWTSMTSMVTTAII